MLVAQIISIVFFVYVGIGILFAIYFVFRRAHEIDPAAKDAGIFFRLVILFGSAGLWPFLLNKAFGDAEEPVERNAQPEMGKRGECTSVGPTTDAKNAC